MSPIFNILLVEDNSGDAGLIQTALAEVQAPAQIHWVENAVQCFMFLSKRDAFSSKPPPDVIILDLNLPVINGLEILRAVRGTPAWRSIPVIVFSSSDRKDDRDICLGLGAVAHYKKPAVWSEYLNLARLLKHSLLEDSCLTDDGSQVTPPSNRIV